MNDARLMLDYDRLDMLTFVNDIVNEYNGYHRVSTVAHMREVVKEFEDRLNLICTANDIYIATLEDFSHA